MQDKPSPIKKHIESLRDERVTKLEARFNALEKDKAEKDSQLVRTQAKLELLEKLQQLSTVTLRECELLLLFARVVSFLVGVALLGATATVGKCDLYSIGLFSKCGSQRCSISHVMDCSNANRVQSLGCQLAFAGGGALHS